MNNTATQAGLPALPGLAVDEALKRLNGSVKLYLRLLGRFLESYGQGQGRANYNEALAGSDAEAPMRFAHTLKGLAASLGANELMEAAKVLEMAHKDGPTAESGLAEACLEKLESLCAMLEQALGAPATPAAAPAASSAAAPAADPAARELLDKIKALLADDDAEAAALFNDNESLLATVLPAATLGRMRQAMAAYDFSEALAALEG